MTISPTEALQLLHDNPLYKALLDNGDKLFNMAIVQTKLATDGKNVTQEASDYRESIKGLLKTVAIKFAAGELTDDNNNKITDFNGLQKYFRAIGNGDDALRSKELAKLGVDQAHIKQIIDTEKPATKYGMQVFDGFDLMGPLKNTNFQPEEAKQQKIETDQAAKTPPLVAPIVAKKTVTASQQPVKKQKTSANTSGKSGATAAPTTVSNASGGTGDDCGPDGTTNSVPADATIDNSGSMDDVFKNDDSNPQYKSNVVADKGTESGGFMSMFSGLFSGKGGFSLRNIGSVIGNALAHAGSLIMEGIQKLFGAHWEATRQQQEPQYTQNQPANTSSPATKQPALTSIDAGTKSEANSVIPGLANVGATADAEAGVKLNVGGLNKEASPIQPIV